MNTPRTRPLVRHTAMLPKTKGRKRKHPDGTYTAGLYNPKIAGLVGEIVATLPQIEERLIEIMALLLGDKKAPARQVFRALNSEDARIKVMRALLEQSPANISKGQEYDDIIDLFAEIKKKRNGYVHGLWNTHDNSGRTFLSEPSTNDLHPFLSQREVRAKELEQVLSRMATFFNRSMPILYPGFYDKDGQRLPSL